MPIQQVKSGIFKYGLSSENRGRAAIPGTVFISIDSNGNVTGDIRVHDGVKKGGIGTPPPGTVSYMIPKKNSTNPDVSIQGQSFGFDVRDGWLFCDGAILNKDEYGSLYDAIGDDWNVNTNLQSNQFQIPDLRGYFIRCYNGATSFGASSRQEDTIKKHSHYVVLNQDGNHHHDYINWYVNPVFNGVNPNTNSGVLNNPSVPGDGTRAVYGVAKMTNNNMDSKIVGNEDISFTYGQSGWNNSSYDTTPDDYVVLGEGFTRPMGTYQNGTWTQAVEQHKHYMLTKDAQGITLNEEGTCVNIKIPAFIKY